MKTNIECKEVRKEDLSRWANEGGAVVETDPPIEPLVDHESNQHVDHRPLPSASVDSTPKQEVLTTSSEEEDLPIGIKIVIYTVVPLAIGLIAGIVALVSTGTIRYFFYFLAVVAFVCFGLRMAWVEKEPDSDVL